MVRGGWDGRRYEAEAFFTSLSRLAAPSSLFLVGPEVLLRDEIVRRLREKVLGGGEGERFGREVFSARETPLSEVASGMRLVGLFCESRLVIVTDLERYGRASQADRQDFWSCLETPSPGVHMILVTEKSLWEMERGGEFIRGTLERVDAIVRLEHPSAAAAVEIVRRAARERHGLDLSEEAARRLVDAVGPNLLDLQHEVDRLALRLGRGTRVAESDLADWLRSGTVGTLNDLEAALRARDLPRALRMWDAVRSATTVPAVSWILASRQLDPRWNRRGSGGGDSARLLDLCYRLERGVKSGAIPSALQDAALEMEIVRLCSSDEAGRSRPPTR